MTEENQPEEQKPEGIQSEESQPQVIEPEEIPQEEGMPPVVGIFRLHTLDMLHNPSQLDAMLEVVSKKNWLLLFSIIGIFTVAFIWSIFGSLAVNMIGKGIVINTEGLYSIQNRAQGIVKQIYALPGDVVEKGTLIAELTDPEKELMLERAEIKLAKYQKDLITLKEEIQREYTAQREALNSEISSKKFAIEQLKKDIETTEKNFATQQMLAEKGLISQLELARGEQSLIAKRIELENVLASISSLNARLVAGYRTEEFKSKEQEVFRALEERDLLQSGIRNLSVYSYSSGRVLDWLVNPGDMIGQGTPMVWMEHMESGKPTTQAVLGFFPIEKGKQIKVGDRVEVELKTVNTSEFGYLVGKVSQVSHYAESQKNIAKVIQNDGLAIYLTDQMPVAMQIKVELQKDPNTPSGYKWTSGQGPDIKLSTGTIAQLRTVIERIRPIYYVFPIWRLKYVTDTTSTSPATTTNDSNRKPG